MTDPLSARELPSQVFVYGTLMAGQCRENAWPCRPTEQVGAYCYGYLYGRDDYPAMVMGTDRIAGQLWRFLPQEMERVLSVLDRIECYDQPGSPDLYRRVLREVCSLGGDALGMSWTYEYATSPEDDGFTKIRVSSESGYATWSAAE